MVGDAVPIPTRPVDDGSNIRLPVVELKVISSAPIVIVLFPVRVPLPLYILVSKAARLSVAETPFTVEVMVRPESVRV